MSAPQVAKQKAENSSSTPPEEGREIDQSLRAKYEDFLAQEREKNPEEMTRGKKFMGGLFKGLSNATSFLSVVGCMDPFGMMLSGVGRSAAKDFAKKSEEYLDPESFNRRRALERLAVSEGFVDKDLKKQSGFVGMFLGDAENPRYCEKMSEAFGKMAPMLGLPEEQCRYRTPEDAVNNTFVGRGVSGLIGGAVSIFSGRKSSLSSGTSSPSSSPRYEEVSNDNGAEYGGFWRFIRSILGLDKKTVKISEDKAGPSAKLDESRLAQTSDKKSELTQETKKEALSALSRGAADSLGEAREVTGVVEKPTAHRLQVSQSAVAAH